MLVAVRGGFFTEQSDVLLVVFGIAVYISAYQTSNLWAKYSGIETAAGYTTNRLGFRYVKRVSWPSGRILRGANGARESNTFVTDTDVIQNGVNSIRPSVWNRIAVTFYVLFVVLATVRFLTNLGNIDDLGLYEILNIGAIATVFAIPALVFFRARQRFQRARNNYSALSAPTKHQSDMRVFLAQVWRLEPEEVPSWRGMMSDDVEAGMVHDGELKFGTNRHAKNKKELTISLKNIDRSEVIAVDLRFRVVRGLALYYSSDERARKVIIVPEQFGARLLRVADDRTFLELVDAIGV